MLREMRRDDGPQYLSLMERGFPEEAALMGGRPDQFVRVFRRIFRWDSRLLMGFLGLIGRPVARALVIEADGKVVGATIVSFMRGAVYLSSVVVDESYRRRGFARQMLAEARRTAQRTHRRYLVLDVLERNVAARTLYASLGYRPLRSGAHLVHETMARFESAPPIDPAIRAVRRSDVPALVEILRRQTPPEVEKVAATGAWRFGAGGALNRVLSSEGAGWVVDRGHGPEGHVAANVSDTNMAAHLTAPTLAESVDDRLAETLVVTAGAWCAARGVPRILSTVWDDYPRSRAALERVGFRNALTRFTLYRLTD